MALQRHSGASKEAGKAVKKEQSSNKFGLGFERLRCVQGGQRARKKVVSQAPRDRHWGVAIPKRTPFTPKGRDLNALFAHH